MGTFQTRQGPAFPQTKRQRTTGDPYFTANRSLLSTHTPAHSPVLHTLIPVSGCRASRRNAGAFGKAFSPVRWMHPWPGDFLLTSLLIPVRGCSASRRNAGRIRKGFFPVRGMHP